MKVCDECVLLIVWLTCRLTGSTYKELASTWGSSSMLYVSELRRSNTVGRVSIPCGDLMIARAEMDASGIGGGYVLS